MSFEADGFNLGYEIGHGVFGDSFVGRHRSPEAIHCAIKRLKSIAIDRRHMSDMLTRLDRLKGHPGIVRVVDWKTDESPSWVASEFQGKGSRSARTVNHLFGTFENEEEALDLLLELATTLSTLHGEGILHGNLHPGNIFLAPEGAENRCRIADFGQAYIGSAHHISITEDSLRTLAPEQLLRPDQFGSQDAFRWDVYAFGVLAYRILTGEWPRGQRYIETYGAECEAHHGARRPLEITRFLNFLNDEKKVARWFGDPATESCERIRGVIEDCLTLEPENRPRPGSDIRIRLTQISHEIEVARRQREFAAEKKTLNKRLFLTRATALMLVSLSTFAALYGVTNLGRALKAESKAEDRSAYLTILGMSLAETNTAYGHSIEQLCSSREAADRFYAELTTQSPLPANPQHHGPETDYGWLRFAESYYGGTIEKCAISWNSNLESARAHHGLAHAALSLGDGATAAKHFQEAALILEGVAEQQPEGDLHVECFRRLGDCYQQLSTLKPSDPADSSPNHLERSAYAFRTALESRPDDENLLLNAAVAFYRLGLHQGECGLQEPALDTLSRSLEFLSKVGELRELRDEEHFLAARAYTSSGALLSNLNLAPAALDAHVMSLEILIELTANVPKRPSFQIELARCYRELGDLFQSIDAEESAPAGDPHQMLIEANRILLSVLAEHPDHPMATLALAQTSMSQSKLNRGKRNSEALKLGKKSVELLADLVKRHPENRSFPFQLAAHQIEYMDLLAKAASVRDAVKLGEEAGATLESLLVAQRDPADSPEIKKYQLTLAGLYEQLGALTEKQSRSDIAAAHYAKAIDYWQLLESIYGAEEEIGNRLAASRKLLDQIRGPGGAPALTQAPDVREP